MKYTYYFKHLIQAKYKLIWFVFILFFVCLLLEVTYVPNISADGIE